MDFAQAITGGGLILLLATVIGYLLNANWKDRQQHQEVVKRFDTKIETLESAHNSRLSALEAKYETRVAHLETRIDNLEREVDTERGLRQAAEFAVREAKHRLSLMRPFSNGGETE